MEFASMGLGFAEIDLLRGADLILVQEGYLEPDRIRRCTVRAMVDSGATMLAIPEYVGKQLEGIDVLIDLKREGLIINPESPDVAKMMLM